MKRVPIEVYRSYISLEKDMDLIRVGISEMTDMQIEFNYYRHSDAYFKAEAFRSLEELIYQFADLYIRELKRRKTPCKS